MYRVRYVNRNISVVECILGQKGSTINEPPPNYEIRLLVIHMQDSLSTGLIIAVQVTHIYFMCMRVTKGNGAKILRWLSTCASRRKGVPYATFNT